MHTMTWEDINKTSQLMENRFNNTLQVIDLLMSLPSGSSECERGFSVMKSTKTQYRNSLKSSTLTLLTTVKLHTPDISEYDPVPAIQQWMTNRHRKPNFMAKKKQKQQCIVQVLQEVEEAEASGVSGGAEQPVKEKIEDDESDFSDLGFSEDDMSEDETTEGAADEEEDPF